MIGGSIEEATMRDPIPELFDRYLTLTGDAGAAATLVLAHCQSHRGAAPSASRSVLTPPQVAKQIGCAPETVVGWIRSGALKASNLAKGERPRYIVDPDDLANFLRLRQPLSPVPAERVVKSKAKNYRVWRSSEAEQLPRRAA
jgi:hypothetical protein